MFCGRVLSGERCGAAIPERGTEPAIVVAKGSELMTRWLFQQGTAQRPGIYSGGRGWWPEFDSTREMLLRAADAGGIFTASGQSDQGRSRTSWLKDCLSGSIAGSGRAQQSADAIKGWHFRIGPGRIGRIIPILSLR